MIKPVIHLNGTSSDSLAEGYANTVTALRAAISATEQVAPNARDYYVFGDAGYPQAVVEHVGRLKRLRSVLEELTELRDHCSDPA